MKENATIHFEIGPFQISFKAFTFTSLFGTEENENITPKRNGNNVNNSDDRVG